MAFGQTSGPPASHRQVQELLVLLQEAGHQDFRDARGPMGFTQRQAAGRFTRDEAATFIEQLMSTDAGGGEGGRDGPVPSPRQPVSAAERREAEQVRRLAEVPAELLAGELQRRGWIVMAP